MKKKLRLLFGLLLLLVFAFVLTAFAPLPMQAADMSEARTDAAALCLQVGEQRPAREGILGLGVEMVNVANELRGASCAAALDVCGNAYDSLKYAADEKWRDGGDLPALITWREDSLKATEFVTACYSNVHEAFSPAVTSTD